MNPKKNRERMIEVASRDYSAEGCVEAHQICVLYMTDHV